MSKYKIDYRDVMCIDVDWGNDIFTLFYLDVIIKYRPQKQFQHSSAEEITIKTVIDMFLRDMKYNGKLRYFATIRRIDEKIEILKDEQIDCSKQYKMFYAGSIQALEELRNEMVNMISEQRF